MFGKENYLWMLIGVVIIALGMFLMSGGRSNVDPNVFDSGSVYSARRITIAPILILIGLVVEMYAIFKKIKVVFICFKNLCKIYPEIFTLM